MPGDVCGEPLTELATMRRSILFKTAAAILGIILVIARKREGFG
jgi:hypothetical protein